MFIFLKMWLFKKKLEDDEQLNQLLYKIIMKENTLIERMWILTSSIDNKRFYINTETNEKNPIYDEEIRCYQNLFWYKERFISEKNNLKRIAILNELLSTMERIQHLNYSTEDKNKVNEYRNELVQCCITDKHYVNNTYWERLQKEWYDMFVLA